ncbi:MAG: hypothetical protein WCE68_02200 [Anaerolineales bacterium]
MKKWMVVSIVIGLVLALTACGSAANRNAAATASTALSQEGQLLVGTLKLENTSLAVTPEQAGDLLPLWETLQSLASSNTAASQEVDAVVSQIKSSMNSQQISSIAAMKLTQQDLAAAAENAGVSATTTNSASTAKTSVTQLQAGAGGPDGGNPPGDMGGETDIQSTGQTQATTTQSTTVQSAGTTNQIPVALIKTLVELLKKKAG